MANRHTRAAIRQENASEFNSKRQSESDIAIDQVAHIGNSVTEHEGAVQAHAEREARIAFRVDSTSDQHTRIHDAAATPFDPTLSSTRAAVTKQFRVALADETAEIDFGTRLGEREVRRAEASRGPGAEHHLGKVVEGALEVGHRDAFVDGEALDLVEHRRMRRVELVSTEHPPRTDNVNRRFTVEHCASLNCLVTAARVEERVGSNGVAAAS